MFSGRLPSITELLQIKVTKNQQTSLQCKSQGQPGLHMKWSSQAKHLDEYISINEGKTIKRISDLHIIRESNLTIHLNISQYIRDDSNNVSCVVHVNSSTSAMADCSLAFFCATFYEKGLEASNMTSLTVTGFDGGKTYDYFFRSPSS